MIRDCVFDLSSERGSDSSENNSDSFVKEFYSKDDKLRVF